MRGLNNFGNTCYLNFILQILFNTPNFRKVFDVYADGIKEHPLYQMTYAFSTLMDVYHYKTDDNVMLSNSLKHFVQIFHQSHNQFGFGQQDGHEYFTFLMRAIHDSMHIGKTLIQSGTPTNRIDQLEQIAIETHRIDGSSTTELMLKAGSRLCYDSVVFQLFSGQYHFQTQCRNQGCGFISNKFETFRCCEIPIGNPDKNIVQLSEILDEFTSVTELEEKYECDKCNVRTNSFRRCTFWRLPEILVISLKRSIFHKDKSGRYRELKDNRVVSAPDILDIQQWCTVPRDKTTYHLYATGNHMGTPRGGHYYAQIKQNGKWYIANDEHIKEGLGAPEHICLLFYRLV